ncbi:MAG TPA: ABC transporter permease [Gemmatimonadales bacterium]
MRRALAGMLTVLAALTLIFVAIHLAPGTPFMPRGDRPPFDAATVARLRAQFGLDQPLVTQYGHYMSALAHGQLGESFAQRRPVAALLAEAIPNTLLLASAALAIEFLLGLAIGVFQAAHRGSRWDTALTNLTLLFYSLPTFWFGLVLLLCFGQWLHWLPVGGIVDPITYASSDWFARVGDRAVHLVLPALTLGLVGAAGTARFQRSAMLDALAQDFVRVARANGVSERRLIWDHALRNALLPYITLLGLALPFLLTGAVVVETVFAWPGMGKLAADAIATRDYPVVTATTLLATVLVVIGSACADVGYAAADPRARATASP